MNLKVTIEEAKKLQVQMLKYIDKICQENSINYSLAHGTLIGAIRHKGFIPWDDDIDILLYRSEYDRLVSILDSQNNQGVYNLLTIKTPSYYLPYAKLCDNHTSLQEIGWPRVNGMGVFIDIFPIDNLPSSSKECFKLAKRLFNFKKRIRYSLPKIWYYSPYPWKRIIKFLLFSPYALYCKAIGTSRLLAQVDKLARKYNYIDTVKAGFLLSHYTTKEIFPRSILNEYIDVEFEGHYFKSIKDYDIYLKQLYGNYMELPPVEEQIPHHANVAVWID